MKSSEKEKAFEKPLHSKGYLGQCKNDRDNDKDNNIQMISYLVPSAV